jgi:hypothetical protein
MVWCGAVVSLTSPAFSFERLLESCDEEVEFDDDLVVLFPRTVQI